MKMNPPIPSRMYQVLISLLSAFAIAACSTSQQRHANKISLIANTGSEEEQYATLTSVLAQAEQALNSGLNQPAQQASYNQAVEDATTLLIKHGKQAQYTRKLTMQGMTSPYTIQVSWPKKLRFDKLIPSQLIKNKVLRQSITREGVGASFVAQWNATPERQNAEPFLSSRGYFTSVTATLDFQHTTSGQRTASLVLHNPNTTELVQLNKKSYPLTLNASALAEHILSLDSQFSAFDSLIRASQYLDLITLHSISPPDPNRIPIIFCHGLASEPQTWQNTCNELQSDPIIREHCQFYFFQYPSGVPVLYSAAILREKIDLLYQKLNTQSNNHSADQMMMVGHSMGGLITKSQIQHSGNKLWLSFLEENENYAHLSEAQLAKFKKYLIFKPSPHISRAVFIATPHRGSEITDYWLIRQLRKLIQAPAVIVQEPLSDIYRNNNLPTDDVTHKLFKSGIPTGVKDLSPQSEFVKNTINLPFGTRVKVHSIVGNHNGLDLTDPKCSDGVVPYSSAHIHQAQSETVIPYGHRVHQHPMAIEELRRIMRLHVKKTFQ